VDESRPRLELNIEYPYQLSRWLIFVKWLLAIPHYFALAFLAIAALGVSIIAFFAILITGRYPEGLWRFNHGYLNWMNNVNAYSALMRDEYPPFSFETPGYPATLSLDYPARLSRLLIFVKWILVIPHMIALWILGIGAGIVWFVAFFAILFTGKYPPGMFRFYEGYLRWTERVNAYLLLMTDDYPPFTIYSDVEPSAQITPDYKGNF